MGAKTGITNKGAYIKLYSGEHVLVDKEDYDELNKYVWRKANGRGTTYAYRNEKERPGIFKRVMMHRAIMKTPKGLVVDHVNHNGLDNRKCNLRNCTYTENLLNSNKKIMASSGYMGVHKLRDKWMARIQFENITYRLGYFKNKVDAAMAYNEKAREFFGKYARLNIV